MHPWPHAPEAQRACMRALSVRPRCSVAAPCLRLPRDSYDVNLTPDKRKVLLHQEKAVLDVLGQARAKGAVELLPFGTPARRPQPPPAAASCCGAPPKPYKCAELRLASQRTIFTRPSRPAGFATAVGAVPVHLWRAECAPRHPAGAGRAPCRAALRAGTDLQAGAVQPIYSAGRSSGADAAGCCCWRRRQWQRSARAQRPRRRRRQRQWQGGVWRRGCSGGRL